MEEEKSSMPSYMEEEPDLFNQGFRKIYRTSVPDTKNGDGFSTDPDSKISTKQEKWIKDNFNN